MFIIKRENKITNDVSYYKRTLKRKKEINIFTKDIKEAKVYERELPCYKMIEKLEKQKIRILQITFEKIELKNKKKMYYLVDELDNGGWCFDSISEIKMVAKDSELKLEELNIYETVMKSFSLNAESIIDNEIESGEYQEYFEYNDIPKNKVTELQSLLNNWCKDIDTDTYEKSKKLSNKEVLKILEKEEKNDRK